MKSYAYPWDDVQSVQHASKKVCPSFRLCNINMCEICHILTCDLICTVVLVFIPILVFFPSCATRHINLQGYVRKFDARNLDMHVQVCIRPHVWTVLVQVEKLEKERKKNKHRLVGCSEAAGNRTALPLMRRLASDCTVRPWGSMIRKDIANVARPVLPTQMSLPFRSRVQLQQIGKVSKPNS